MIMATTSMTTTNTLSFDDIFHELNDDLETEANEWQYLNHFYLNFEDEIQIREELTRSNTSQQQQQHQSPIAVSISKKKRNENDEDHPFFYDIPDYLSASSSSFGTTFFTELRSYKPIDFQDLQQLNLLTHQTSIIHLHEQLWHCFLQAGKGQLKQPISQYHTDSTTLSFWPKIVTSVMISKGIIPHDDNRQDKIDQDIYINFIQNYLHQLEKQAKQRRLQYDAITNRLPPGYDNGILNDKIEHFLRNEDSLSAMKLHFQRRIALIEYICIDRSYQLAYFQQKPTNLQLQIGKQICFLTYDREKAEQELILFKFGVLYKKLPKSLDLLEISLPTSITTISDPVICERLSNQYQRIIQRAKVDLMDVLAMAAEAKKNDSQKKFNKEIADIWKNQRQYPMHERLTSAMLTIIEQRQKNIIECIKCIYELKGDFCLKAPQTTMMAVIH